MALTLDGTTGITTAQLFTTGSVGVGTSEPDYDLEVVGDIGTTGTVTAGYSDERLKLIQGNILNAVEKVNQLHGFYYIENEIAKNLGCSNDRVQVGLSAQEVEQVLPEVVTDSPIKNDQNYKTIWYDRLIPLLVEAIKEQQVLIESLTNRIIEIESNINK